MRRFRFLVLVLVIAVVAAAGLVACDRSQTQATEPLPDWIEQVRPTPDADTTGNKVVSVDQSVLQPQEQVRLEVDGVDVTDQVRHRPLSKGKVGPLAPARLQYDPSTVTDPLVKLTPGEHSATAVLLRYPQGFEAGHPKTIDRYHWSFRIL